MTELLKQTRTILPRHCLLAALLGIGMALSQGLSLADELRQLWTLAPSSRTYLTTGNTERGLAYNPKTGHLLLMSRAAGLTITILNPANGDEIGAMDTSGISGGTFALSLIGVADDGAIYGANLATATQSLKVYRWQDENSMAAIAFEGDPTGGVGPQRWGDSFDVRGAGAKTQILLGSNAGTTAALLVTADGQTFTPVIVSNAAAAGALGVAFGAGDTFWTKKNAQSLRHVGFNLTTGAGSILQNFTTTTFPGSGNVAPIGLTVSNNVLYGLAAGPNEVDNIRAYDISDLSAAPVLIDQKPLPTDNANGNLVGAIETFGDLVWVLDTNNGLVAYRLVPSVVPPSITAQPISAVTVIEGANVSLTATAIGTKPLSYQWFLGTNALAGGTNSSLVVSNISFAEAGGYILRVSNAAGVTNSRAANITVVHSVRTPVLTPLWNIPVNSRSYITDGNTERGVAYNPKSGHVLVVTRTTGVNVYVLDAATGKELWKLNTDPTIVFGSNPDGFRLNMIGVADDGVVYAASLETGGNKFFVYRWQDDSTNSTPYLCWQGDPGLGQRWGDNMDVRGAGLDTQLLFASRNGTAVAIMTTFDGQNFESNIIDTPNATPGNFGLGIAFGKGDTFWGKATGTNAPLRHVQFDLATGQGTILHTFPPADFPGSIAAIAVDPVTSSLFGIGVETPDTLRTYSIANLNATPILRDVDFFPSDVDNLNATGAIDVSNDLVVALDTNNGLMAMRLNKALLRAPRLIVDNRPVNGTFTITFQGIPGDVYTVEGSTDLRTWTPIFTVGADPSGLITLGDSAAGTLRYRFYRASVK